VTGAVVGVVAVLAKEVSREEHSGSECERSWRHNLSNKRELRERHCEITDSLESFLCHEEERSNRATVYGGDWLAFAGCRANKTAIFGSE
jgi:hypothetical protein